MYAHAGRIARTYQPAIGYAGKALRCTQRAMFSLFGIAPSHVYDTSRNVLKCEHACTHGTSPGLTVDCRGSPCQCLSCYKVYRVSKKVWPRHQVGSPVGSRSIHHWSTPQILRLSMALMSLSSVKYPLIPERPVGINPIKNFLIGHGQGGGPPYHIS